MSSNDQLKSQSNTQLAALTLSWQLCNKIIHNQVCTLTGWHVPCGLFFIYINRHSMQVEWWDTWGASSNLHWSIYFSDISDTFSTHTTRTEYNFLLSKFQTQWKREALITNFRENMISQEKITKPAKSSNTNLSPVDILSIVNYISLVMCYDVQSPQQGQGQYWECLSHPWPGGFASEINPYIFERQL